MTQEQKVGGTPAIFLDRDGTLIRDTGYLSDPEQVALVPGAASALRRLRKYGFIFIIVTNQSGIGRGLFSAEQAELVNQRVVEKLKNLGIQIAGVYYCPHVPEDNCRCRKPSPELVFLAAREHDVDLRRSFFVGNKEADAQSGKNAGMPALHLKMDCIKSRRKIARAWNTAARRILLLADDF